MAGGARAPGEVTRIRPKPGHGFRTGCPCGGAGRLVALDGTEQWCPTCSPQFAPLPPRSTAPPPASDPVPRWLEHVISVAICGWACSLYVGAAISRVRRRLLG